MLEHLGAILDVIQRTDLREADMVAGRERFYRRDLDPERWLRVVVGMKVKSFCRVAWDRATVCVGRR